jgi:hypothetical protein
MISKLGVYSMRKFLFLLFLLIIFSCDQVASCSQENEELISSFHKSTFVPKSPIEQVMYSTVRIETDKSLGTAFAFNFQLDQKEQDLTIPCLITNKHVVKGASNGKLIFHCSEKNKPEPSGRNFHLAITNFENRWVGHPDEDIDLCVMLIEPIINQVHNFCNFDIFYKSLAKQIFPPRQVLENLLPAQDIIMVGYPKGLYDEVNNFPIVRKGITASHPAINYNGKPEFLIDAACFPGSSGSPVFAYSNGVQTLGTNVILGGSSLYFLGILSEGPHMVAEGKIVVKKSPMSEIPISETNVMLHLGYVIKFTTLEKIRLNLIELLSGEIKEKQKSVSSIQGTTKLKALNVQESERREIRSLSELTSLLSSNSNENTLKKYKPFSEEDLQEMIKLSMFNTYIPQNKEIGKLLASYQQLDIDPQVLEKAKKLYELSISLLDSNADENLKVAAKMGYSKAQNDLAMKELISDPSSSKHLLFKAAAQGNSEALFNLSQAYESLFEEFELEENPIYARYLCEEAAHLGHDRAAFYLASSFLDGSYGNPKNHEKAMQELKKLSNSGNKLAEESWNRFKSMSPELLKEVLDSLK